MSDHWTLSAADRARIVAALSGASHTLAYPPAITVPGEGGKFTPQGEVLEHPGNTFLCHIDPTSVFYDRLSAVQDGLQAGPWGECMTFLPKPSFHMTVFCGISGAPLGADGWPEGMDRSATLGEITALYIERLSRLAAPSGYRVRPVGANGPVSIRMQPDGPEETAQLRGLRDVLSNLTGLNRPDHFTYNFHVSLAYMTRLLSCEEAEELLTASETLFARHLRNLGPVELGPVAFCRFETMCRFDTLGTLGSGGYRPLH
ncbi:DUF1868 domain-containing protein [Tabrizicola sp.]|uniref:DUF1868 domain-containing protein n=1 Tax=Tabrizicola sp. TaxID=2005166 RepID=UPI003F3AD834